MTEHPKIIELKSGRAVAMTEYGDANGEPVVFCHGWPSSRTMAQLTDDAARELNLRIISPDRPGIRHSAFHANRKLLDWPPLIAEVADNLDIANFRMLAVSGGAPYALATAWAMPQRVRAISIVSGAPPIADLADRAGLFPLYRWMLFFYRKQPEVLRRSFQIARPFLSVRMPLRLRPLLLKLLQPCDADVLRDSAAFEIFFESQRQAWRGSAHGVMADAQIYAEPWGFPLEEILTAEQVASLLQVHPKTVYKFAQEGSIPGRKVGGIWRFSKEAIVRFVAGSERKKLKGTGRN